MAKKLVLEYLSTHTRCLLFLLPVIVLTRPTFAATFVTGQATCFPFTSMFLTAGRLQVSESRFLELKVKVIPQVYERNQLKKSKVDHCALKLDGQSGFNSL